MYIKMGFEKTRGKLKFALHAGRLVRNRFTGVKGNNAHTASVDLSMFNSTDWSGRGFYLLFEVLKTRLRLNKKS